MGKRRGGLTMKSEREEIIHLISEARTQGARQSRACEVIGISAKTFQRWEQPNNLEDGRLERTQRPANKLSELERLRVIKVANDKEYASLPPSKIVPRLADEGRYIASESTFYRILKAEKQLNHRQTSKPNRLIKKPKGFCATGPNQLYSWDITYLPTAVRGIFLYLYLVLDIYSRKIVGWQVHEQESSDLSAELMIDICSREKVVHNQVVLHSDNGGPMKGAVMLSTLQKLGVIPSFSRPAVSNDNPYSESMFRTLKYRPEYPGKPFSDVQQARTWVSGFVSWYNTEHLHSAIKFVTPEQRHKGEDRVILAARKRVYEQAKLAHPNRWSRDIRNWDEVKKVHLNPENTEIKNEENKAA